MRDSLLVVLLGVAAMGLAGGCGGDATGAADPGQASDAPDAVEAAAADVPAADVPAADPLGSDPVAGDPAVDPVVTDPGPADPVQPFDPGTTDDGAGEPGQPDTETAEPGAPDLGTEDGDTGEGEAATADDDASDPAAEAQDLVDTGPVECPPVEWASIPGGTYSMGTTDVMSCSGSTACAVPIHAVTVPAFDMGRTEALTCQYALCVSAGSCDATAATPTSDLEPRVDVTWGQSKAYCSWTGGRLCTEAEWEYAARNGGAGTLYPWGDAAPTCDDAVFLDNACSAPTGPSTACSKPAGNDSWGLCDLAGNVSEWVEDCYQGTYDGAPADGSARESCTTYGGATRVTRGGAYTYYADSMRASARFDAYPDGGGGTVGLRCCRTP